MLDDDFAALLDITRILDDSFATLLEDLITEEDKATPLLDFGKVTEELLRTFSFLMELLDIGLFGSTVLDTS